MILTLKIKKILAGILLSEMCAAFLFFPVHIQAAESQTTSITAEVPTSHNVRIAIEGQEMVKLMEKHTIAHRT